MTMIILTPGKLSLADLAAATPETVPETVPEMALAPGWRRAVEASRAVVARAADEMRPVYGVNTGFGTLSGTPIPRADLGELQRRVVLSNAAGVGPLLPDRVVRRMMILKLNTLASGHSGARPELVEALLRLLNAGVLPCVPAKGSVGASGDLAPLAHLAAALIGEGDVRIAGETMPAAQGLARAGLEPLALDAKEGLALVNGTQASTALAVDGLLAAEAVFAAAVAAGAMSVEAALGRTGAFDARIHRLRGQRGQMDVAAAYRTLLEGSALERSGTGRIQDPYSLRCQPQVMGICLDQLRFAAGIIAAELNAVTDNPIVDAKAGDFLYGGNFHAEPVGFAADGIALALAEIGAMAERRVAFLTDPAYSGLPAFLVAEPGLNSGLMVAQVTAAALASENKAMAHPGTVDSIPTTANFEDFVSMATFAARRLGEMAENAANIVAIELLSAAQGLEFRRPGRTSPVLESVHARVRALVPAYDRDRLLAPDIAAVKRLVMDGAFLDILPEAARPASGSSSTQGAQDDE